MKANSFCVIISWILVLTSKSFANWVSVKCYFTLSKVEYFFTFLLVMYVSSEMPVHDFACFLWAVFSFYTGRSSCSLRNSSLNTAYKTIFTGIFQKFQSFFFQIQSWFNTFGIVCTLGGKDLYPLSPYSYLFKHNVLTSSPSFSHLSAAYLCPVLVPMDFMSFLNPLFGFIRNVFSDLLLPCLIHCSLKKFFDI